MSPASDSSAAQSRDFIGKTLSFESMVHYQNHSVVSKQILDKKAGTLTLFAFDKGEGLREHTAPYDASVFIFDGTAEITIGGKPHIVHSGEFIIMPAHISHSLKAVDRFKMLLIMIRSE